MVVIICVSVCLRCSSTFQIVSFGSSYRLLFLEGSRKYDDDSLAFASAALEGMSADMGGTEILAPLQAVFSDAVSGDRARQILVFTDGEVMNTREVVEYCKKQHESTGARVFGFGIGDQVSHALLQGMAAGAGGEAEFVGSGERMEVSVRTSGAPLCSS